MRWLYHLLPADEVVGDRYAPPSLRREGFIHCSFRDAVAESARLHFPPSLRLAVLQIDPRRLDARVDVADTPRGPMPHLHGALPADAIRARLDLAAVAAAPDAVTGTRFAFVAFAGMTLLDLVGVYDPIARLAGMGFDPDARCEIVAAEEAPWRGAGAVLTVPRVRPPLHDFDALVVPGGFGARRLVEERAVIEWLATFPHNRLVASVCTGALLLGAAGRLRGHRATTHAGALDLLAAFGATAVRERVVDEGQLVTAGGVTSGLDLGLHLVRRFAGDGAAERIAAQMELRPLAP
jgi:putative intracellular protease/amidase/uncharacterized protein (DUF952 family)